VRIIEIIGPECPRSLRSVAEVRKVVDGSQVDVEIRHVTDPDEIVARGVLFAIPAIAVDGVLVSKGRVPSRKDIERWLEVGSGAGAR
jgi:small redox-active disulfide protein 2